MENKTYSNPRLTADIENWPIGGGKRGTAHFFIEQGTGREGQERAVRVTFGKPKKLTYATKARIVDGSDGRTYIAELSAYGFICIKRGDMKHDEENIFERDARFEELKKLF